MPEPKSTNDVLESPRGMVAYRESTHDPIFLFQIREYGTSPHDIQAMEDMGWHCDEGWYVSDEEDADKVTYEMMEDNEIGTSHWYTRAVFAHREEARHYGQSRPYAWGEEGKGWQIYCVCAYGDLAKALLPVGDING